MVSKFLFLKLLFYFFKGIFGTRIRQSKMFVFLEKMKLKPNKKDKRNWNLSLRGIYFLFQSKSLLLQKGFLFLSFSFLSPKSYFSLIISIKRALMVWDNESTCLRFPITCTEKEKLQIEIRNRERDLALLANKSKPNKTIESVQRDWSGVPALLFSRHRRISRKKPRKIDEEKEVGNGGILGFFKTIFGVF